MVRSNHIQIDRKANNKMKALLIMASIIVWFSIIFITALIMVLRENN